MKKSDRDSPFAYPQPRAPAQPSLGAGEGEWYNYHLNAALFWEAENQWEEAIKHLRSSYAFHPRDYDLALREARLCHNLANERSCGGSRKAAAGALRQALLAYQDAARLAVATQGDADYEAAAIATQLDMHDEAEEHLERAFRKDASFVGLFLGDAQRPDDLFRTLRGRPRCRKVLDAAQRETS